MASCYQKHPFGIETEDKLTTINTKIFEIKKKIQLSEGQRKSHHEENESEKQNNKDLIETLKKEIKIRQEELSKARALAGEEDLRIKKYLREFCPAGSKNVDQVINHLDFKVVEQRKALDLLRYEQRKKRAKLKEIQKEYELLLIEESKSATEKVISTNPIKKRASHLENEIHKVLVQWNEAELVKKKYAYIRKALIEDAVKFDSSLDQVNELLRKQGDEIAKLERIREEAAEMRMRATAALMEANARAQDDEQQREAEREYFAERFHERRRELEKLEKRIFPPTRPPVVRQASSGSLEGADAEEEKSEIAKMEEIFERLMKLTGVVESEQVFDRFRAQRETSKRLSYLQTTTEEEKLHLEKLQGILVTELEAYKFASVKDKDEAQEKISDIKQQISQEQNKKEKLETEREEIESQLHEIKKLLYDLCKLLDIMSTPPMPEWTAEARDVHYIVEVLSARYDGALTRVAEIRQKREDATPSLPSNPPSGAASMGGASAHTTPREPVDTPIPTYKEFLLTEPTKSTPSDEEEEIPSRSYLKRQAQLIVDTKSRRKGYRVYMRK